MPASPQLDSDVLTVEEAAAMLWIGRNAAYALARRWRDTSGEEGIRCAELGRTAPRQALLDKLQAAPTAGSPI